MTRVPTLDDRSYHDVESQPIAVVQPGSTFVLNGGLWRVLAVEEMQPGAWRVTAHMLVPIVVQDPDTSIVTIDGYRVDGSCELCVWRGALAVVVSDG